MKTAGRLILFTIISIVTVMGVLRLRFDTDLTSVMPPEVAQVEAVKSFNQYFQDDQHVAIWLQTKEDKVYAEDATDLAEYLMEHLGAVVVYSADIGHDPLQYAKDVAKVWALSPPALVNDFTETVTSESQTRTNLSTLKEEIRSSITSGLAIKRSYDPLGFMRHPGLERLSQADYSFVSDDGKSRFLLVKQPSIDPQSGYAEDLAWLDRLRAALNEWNGEYDNAFRFGLTGGPVYNAEVGTGMQKDLLGTLGITLALISALFLILQRSLGQLLMLAGVAATTFFLTLGIAGWFIPSLNVLSMGFGAILLGLVIDYAVVLLREANHFEPERRAIRKGMRGSILWAALTTSLVFSVLLLSSFPGVQQLGLLILIGLTAGAFVTLYAVPWYIELVKPKRGIVLTRPARQGTRILFAPLLILLTGLVVFLFKGSPPFSFSLAALQPKSSEASTVQSDLSKHFSSWSDLRTVVFAHAENPQALSEKLQIAETAAYGLEDQGLFSAVQLPSQLIPQPDSYSQNLVHLKSILDHWDQLTKIAEEEGFTSKALQYDHVIAKTFAELPESYEEFQALHTSNSITKSMIAHDQGRTYFRGNVTLSEPLTPEALAQMSALNQDDIIMTGWGTLGATLEPIVKRDFRSIFLPSALIILLALAFVFRNWREAVLVLFTLLTALVSTNALMTLFGLQWNFLNVIAFPLIIGVGIDYSIHLIFAMRRQGAIQQSVWQGVGLAITFCGLSSVIGFGSLSFAQNDVLRSLGQICAIGVSITMTLTLLITPPVWRAWCNRSTRHSK